MPCGLFHTVYKTDERIFKTIWVKSWLVAFGFFLLLLPFLVSNYVLYVCNMISIFIVGGIGLNILTGFTGQISIGHGAFVAVGAYTSAILTTKLGFPFWIALPIAGFFAAFIGMIFGIPSLRIKGLYLAIATLAAQFIIDYAIVHWEHLTNGITGISVPSPTLFGFVFDNDKKFYYLLLGFALVAVVSGRNLFRTRVGRAFIAIRDRDISAELIGVDIFKYKLLAFGISSFYAGVAGSLWGHYTNVITPEHFTIVLSIDYLAMIIVGGLGSILGTVFGVVFMIIVPELLNTVGILLKSTFGEITALISAIKGLVFGVTIILFLVFEPDGLFEIWRRVRDYWKLWPFSYR
jgi:branched-chain amino acid transport system permease protein